MLGLTVLVVTSCRTKKVSDILKKWEFVIFGCSLCNEAQIYSHTSTFFFVTQQAKGLKGCFTKHGFIEIAICLCAKHPFYLHFHYRRITVPKQTKKTLNQSIFEHVCICIYLKIDLGFKIQYPLCEIRLLLYIRCFNIYKLNYLICIHF